MEEILEVMFYLSALCIVLLCSVGLLVLAIPELWDDIKMDWNRK